MIMVQSSDGKVRCSIVADSHTEIIVDAIIATYGCCKIVSEHTHMSKSAALLFMMQQIQQYIAKGGEENEQPL